MSGLFGGGDVTVAKSPGDDSAREAAERMRRNAQNRGRSATVLTQTIRSGASGAAPRRTVIGGGG